MKRAMAIIILRPKMLLRNKSLCTTVQDYSYFKWSQLFQVDEIP